MQRDKRGRFVKKAQEGTILTINGKQRKVKQGAIEAYQKYKETNKENVYTDSTLELWLAQPENQQWLEPEETPASLNTSTIGFNTNLGFTPFQSKSLTTPEIPKTQTYQEQLIHDLGVQNGVYDKTKYDANSDGSFITEDGKQLSIFEITHNKDLYESYR